MSCRQGRAALGRTAEGGRPHLNLLVRGLFGVSRRDLDLRVGVSSGFVASQVEIESERIEGDHGEFVAEGVEFAFAPAAIQAHGVPDVIGESLAIITFTDQDIADEASGMNVIDAAAGLAMGIGQAEKYFSDSAEFGTVVPGLGSVNFGMMAFGAGG